MEPEEEEPQDTVLSRLNSVVMLTSIGDNHRNQYAPSVCYQISPAMPLTFFVWVFLSRIHATAFGLGINHLTF
jgi:hypothetical protein